jgi:CRISPR system Cascade subunit CasE
LFLARLELNPRSRLARRDWADCQELHRTLMSCFAHLEANSARAELQVLFRRELQRGCTTVLLQSAVAPDLKRLPNGYVVAGGAVSRQLDQFFQGIETGTGFLFRLTANATRKIETGRDSGKPNGRRVPLRGEAAVDWLRRKGTQHGFELLSVSSSKELAGVISSEGQAFTGSKRVGSQTYRLKLEAVTFDGALVVRDIGPFKTAFQEGIGPGKAYGCGLLSLAPLRRPPREEPAAPSSTEG